MTTATLFRWAALTSLLTVPTVVCEAVLLGAGTSYRFLAFVTALNALAVATLTRLALLRTGSVVSAWRCIFLFFALRLSVAATRIFAFSEASGLGSWRAGVTRPSR